MANLDKPSIKLSQQTTSLDINSILKLKVIGLSSLKQVKLLRKSSFCRKKKNLTCLPYFNNLLQLEKNSSSILNLKVVINYKIHLVVLYISHT